MAAVKQAQPASAAAVNGRFRFAKRIAASRGLIVDRVGSKRINLRLRGSQCGAIKQQRLAP